MWAVSLVISGLLVYLLLPLVALPSQTWSTRQAPLWARLSHHFPLLCSRPLCFRNPRLRLLSAAWVTRVLDGSSLLRGKRISCCSSATLGIWSQSSEVLPSLWAKVVVLGGERGLLHTRLSWPNPAMWSSHCRLWVSSLVYFISIPLLSLSITWLSCVRYSLLQCQETPSFAKGVNAFV